MQQHHQQQVQPPPLAQTQPVVPQPAAVQQPAPQPAPPAAVVAALDPNKMVAIQITLPAQPNVPNSQPRVLTIQVPASALQENQLQQVLTGPIITSIMPLPPQIASSVLQQHVNSYLQNNTMSKFYYISLKNYYSTAGISLFTDTIQIHKQMDGAYDMSMDTDAEENDQVPILALSEVLDQHLLNKMAQSLSSVAAATSCTKKMKNRRRGEI